MPDFFKQYLASLTDDQNAVMYDLACQDTGTLIRDAIMDVVAPRATAEPE